MKPRFRIISEILINSVFVGNNISIDTSSFLQCKHIHSLCVYEYFIEKMALALTELLFCLFNFQFVVRSKLIDWHATGKKRTKRIARLHKYRINNHVFPTQTEREIKMNIETIQTNQWPQNWITVNEKEMMFNDV